MYLNLRRLLGALITASFLMACGQTKNEESESSASTNPACAPKQFFPSGKAVVEEEWENIPEDLSGQRLTVLLDSACLQDNPLPDGLTIDSEPLTSAWASTDNSYAVEISTTLASQSLEELLRLHPCIRGASPELVLHNSALPNDPQIAQQKYLAKMDWSSVYDFYYSGQFALKNDFVIAIIDDGIDSDHVELREQLWSNIEELNGQPGVDDDDNGYVDDIHGYDFSSRSGDPSHKNGTYHGTHVAGFIAATANNGIGIAGIAGRRARIMALNIFGSSDGATTANVDRAIRYAADNGAKVINMSLGGPGRSATTASALAYAVQKGVFIVAAAGNDGFELNSNNFVTPASYSAQISGMISVAATDVDDPSRLCRFSNFSTTQVEFSAPGCDTSRTDLGIYSTLPDDRGGYLAGTSMASPIAAGGVALMIAMVRDNTGVTLTPAQIESYLVNSSPAQSGIATKVAGGRQMNLKSTADYIRDQFINQPPPPPSMPNCP